MIIRVNHQIRAAVRMCLTAALGALCFFLNAGPVRAEEIQIPYGDLLDIREKAYENTVYTDLFDLTGVDYVTLGRSYTTGGKCCERNKAYAGGTIQISIIQEQTGEIVRRDEFWYAGDGEAQVSFDTSDLNGMHRIAAYVTINTGTCEDCGTRKPVGIKLMGITGHSIQRPPAITEHPANQEADIGGSVTFTVRADNVVQYQWQVRRSGVWNGLSDGALPGAAAVSGAGTDQLTLSNIAYGDHLTAYRCVCYGRNGDQAVSGEASLAVYDRQPPSFDVATHPGEWTREGVTVKILNAYDSGSGLPAEAFSFDGGSTWTASAVKEMRENASLTICVRDHSGNTASRKVEITNIDRTEPQITGIGREPEGWTSQSVKITVSASDRESGLSGQAYSYDGGKTWTASAVREVRENGSLTVCVRDILGNTASRKVEITNIDRTEPQITGIEKNPDGWTNQSVKITVSASDRESGLDGAAYSFDGGKTYQESNVYLTAENGVCQVYVRDKAGNTAGGSVTVDKIDKDAPTAVLKADKEWTAKSVAVQVNAKDTEGKAVSGLPGDAYSYDGGKTWTEEDCHEYDENGPVRILVRDRAGNVAGRSIELKNIDRTPPVILSFQADQKKWTKGPVNLSADALDEGSGLAKRPYSFDGGATWQGKPVYQAEKNGIYEVLVRDAVGNRSRAVLEIGNIDVREPLVRLETATQGWTAGSVRLRVKASDREGGSGLDEKAYSWDMGSTWTGGEEHTADRNGSYTVWVRDRAGNIAQAATEVKNIDKNPPDPVSLMPSETEWTGGDVKVSVRAEDQESGLDENPVSFDGGKTYGQQTETTACENGEISVRVRDKAGNFTDRTFVVNNIDKTAPEARVRAEPEGWTNRTVTLYVEAEDLQSGLHQKPYSFDGGNTWTDSPEHEVGENGSYRVMVRDRCLNQTGLGIQVSRIDRTAPKVVLRETGRDEENQTVRLKAEVTDYESGPLAAGYSWDGGKTYGPGDSIEVYKSGFYTVKVLDAAYNVSSATVFVILGESLADHLRQPERYRVIPRKAGEVKDMPVKDTEEEEEEEPEAVEKPPVLSERPDVAIAERAAAPERHRDSFLWRQYLLLALMGFLLLLPILLLLFVLWRRSVLVYEELDDGSLSRLGAVLIHSNHGQYRLTIGEGILRKAANSRGILKLKKHFASDHGEQEVAVRVRDRETWHKIERMIPFHLPMHR